MTEALAVSIRWVHFGGACLLVGVLASVLLVVGPASRVGPASGPRFASLEARLMRLTLGVLGLTMTALLLDLGRQAGVASGLGLAGSLAPDTLGTVLGQTRYGTVWLVRQALLLLAGLLLLFREGEERPADRLALRLEALVLTGASLGLTAAAGHAASAEGAPALTIGLDAIHLLATGVWLGGLWPLALFLRAAGEMTGGAGVAPAAVATRRFSILALGAVAALILTGGYHAWAQVGSVPALLGTAYGRWLCLKLLLFLGILAVAAPNPLILVPRLAGAAARSSSTAGAAILARLRRHVRGEIALGVLVIGVVAVLGLATPARHDRVAWPLSFRLAWDATKSVPGVQTRVAVGSQVAVLGLVALLLGLIVRRRRQRLAVVGGAVAIILGAAVALPPLAVDANPGTYVRPSVPYAAPSIVQGARLYQAQCATCHGVAGYGDGPAAAGLRPKPADLTAKHTGDHTAGDLFWWLTHGIPGSAMPGFDGRLSPEERWDVINFVRLLGAAEAARGLGPVAASRPSIVAPDFSYTTGVGESRSLRDLRGPGVVLLVLFSLPESLDRLVRLNELYAAMRLAGGDIIGIPLTAPEGAIPFYRRLGPRAIFFPLVVDGAADAAATYREFRRDLTVEGQAPDPPPTRHLELLIDRQGYLRARWMPKDGGGWIDLTRLTEQIERLSREIPVAPLPTEHVH